MSAITLFYRIHLHHFDKWALTQDMTASDRTAQRLRFKNYLVSIPIDDLGDIEEVRESFLRQ